MRTRRREYKWQRQRREAEERRERVKRLKEELARTHSLIGRIDPQESHRELLRLRQHLRTLEQRIRYINVEGIY